MIRLLMLSAFWFQPGDTSEVRTCCMKPEATAAAQTVATTESAACPCGPGCCKDGWCSSCGDWCKNCCGDNCQCSGAKGAKVAEPVKATAPAQTVATTESAACPCGPGCCKDGWCSSCGDWCKNCCGDNCGCSAVKGAKAAEPVKATQEVKTVNAAKGSCGKCCGDNCKAFCGDNCAGCCGAGRTGKAQG